MKEGLDRMAHDVFVSYSAKDKAVAETVCSALESNGIKCWIAPRDIYAGSYSVSIIRAISKCRIMVLIFSASSNKSKQVINEVERATSKGKVVYPFRIEEVSPSEELELFVSSEQWLDAYAPPLDDHLKRLTINVKRLLNTFDESDELTESRGIYKQPSMAGIKPRQFYITAVVVSVILVGLILLGTLSKFNSANMNVAPTITPSPYPDILGMWRGTATQGDNKFLYELKLEKEANSVGGTIRISDPDNQNTNFGLYKIKGRVFNNEFEFAGTEFINNAGTWCMATGKLQYSIVNTVPTLEGSFAGANEVQGGCPADVHGKLSLELVRH